MNKLIILLINLTLISNMQLHCAEQKVGQEAADKLGDQLISAINLRKSNLAEIKKLVEAGANVNKQGKEGDTPLNTLLLKIYGRGSEAPEEDIEILKFLLNLDNINVNLGNERNVMPLYYFLNSGKVLPLEFKSILKQFFSRGAQLDKVLLPHKKNFFDYAADDKLLQEAYEEYLLELKKSHADLCGQLDKDLPEMPDKLANIIADYAKECNLKARYPVSQPVANLLGSKLIGILEDVWQRDCNFELIKKIIDQGANINSFNRSGQPILIILLDKMSKLLRDYSEINKDCIDSLKLFLSQPNIVVNYAVNRRRAYPPLQFFLNIIVKDKDHNQIKPNDIKEILKLFFERGVDLHAKDINGKNFFDYAKDNKILQESYEEYLAELKKKHADLCVQLDKDLPFMSKDLTDLIADYALDCEYKKKEEHSA